MKLFFLLFFFITLVMSNVDNVASALDGADADAVQNTTRTEIIIKPFPFPKECENDADCVNDPRGHVCKGNWFCMPPYIVTKRESTGTEMSIEDFPFSKECETDADCVDDSRGHFCKGHWFCMPPFIITKRESVRDIAAQNFCRANSDCPSDETCSNFSCVAKSVDKAPKVDDSASAFRFIRRSPQSLICHNSVDCDGGYCYHGICVAEPPRLDSELESRSPQGLICHNSADCDGGVCYHGICVAEPPMAQTPKQPRQASQV